MKTSKILSGLAVTGCASIAHAGSLDSVFLDLATAAGTIGTAANYEFNLSDADSTFSVVDNGDAVFGIGDVLNTAFVFESVATGAFKVNLDAPSDIAFGGILGATDSNSTVGVFGNASFEIVGLSATEITVIGNLTDDYLFEVFEDDDSSSTLAPTFGATGTPFAQIGQAPTTLTLDIDSVDLTTGDLVGLDIDAVTGLFLLDVADSLVAPSNVAITGSTASANGVFTITATVVPAPASAGAGLLGLVGLVSARRRRA